MAEPRAQRRLTVIQASDIVGYSRMMEADEAGTLAQLKTLRKEVFDPKFQQYNGRIVKTTGDGVLAEFTSAVDAVEHALDLQETLVRRNRDVPEDRRIVLRIGINIGDVIVEGDDIYGDGVNVAARLEGLAEPASVCLSSDVYRQVVGKIQATFDDMGEQALKNIERPVQAYLARPTTRELARPPESEMPTLPDKPSIAVLPFNNMSGDPEQEFFADGMTEDLITDLSKISGLFVIARNSTFSYKGRQVDVRKVAAELGVRYVLEGSVRKSGDRVRINAQLIDAGTGGHLWADRYDGTVADVFELQDEVGAKVVSALSVQLKGGEKERLEHVHTSNLEAYELFVRAKATPYPPVMERIESAREMFEQVIEMDPEFAGGYAGVSSMLGFGSLFGHSDSSEAIDRATEMARKAIELDETFGWSYTALGMALLQRGQYDEAIAAAEEAIARQPNDADAHAYLGLLMALAGRPNDGIEAVDQAIRLNPQFVNGPYLNMRGQILMLAGDYEESARAIEQNLLRNGPFAPPAMCSAAASYTALGRTDEAARMVGQLTAKNPEFRLGTWNFLSLIHPVAARERVVGLLRRAGVPE